MFSHVAREQPHAQVIAATDVKTDIEIYGLAVEELAGVLRWDGRREPRGDQNSRDAGTNKSEHRVSIVPNGLPHGSLGQRSSLLQRLFWRSRLRGYQDIGEGFAVDPATKISREDAAEPSAYSLAPCASHMWSQDHIFQFPEHVILR